MQFRTCIRIGFLLTLALLAAPRTALPEDAAPEVTNERFSDEGKVFRFTYDLETDGPRKIELLASTDGGITWGFPVKTVRGDAGGRIWPGKNKEILWEHGKDHPKGLEGLNLSTEIASGPPDPLSEPGHGVPTYFVIPLSGEVGAEIAAPDVESGLAEAARKGAGTVVFEVDSPGGLIGALYDIADVVSRWKKNHPDTRLAAFVRGNAYSAAAILATLAERIYMAPESAIGAALAVGVSPHGLTQVDEKFASVYRSHVRAIAGIGGHDTALAEAMVSPDTALSLAMKEGKPVVLRGAPGEIAEGGFDAPPRLLLDKGRLLTLTAAEAAGCGLAAGIVRDYAELGNALGNPGWMEAGDAGRQTLVDRRIKVARINAQAARLLSAINDERLRIEARPADSPNYTVNLERDLYALVDAIDELTNLERENPFLTRTLLTSLPRGGLLGLKVKCDELLSKIDARKKKR